MPTVFSLSELAEEWTRMHPADPISSRTLRYYIAGGLLEGPGRVGPGKHYGEHHLKRLEAIRLMQRNGHTIEEIGSLLGDLKPERVADIVEEQRQILKARDDADQRLRGAASGPTENRPKARDTGGSADLLHPARLLKGITSSWKQRTHQGQGEDITWLRVNVASGVEVLIRQDFAAKREKDVRKWLAEGSTLLAVSSHETENPPAKGAASEECHEDL